MCFEARLVHTGKAHSTWRKAVKTGVKELHKIAEEEAGLLPGC